MIYNQLQLLIWPFTFIYNSYYNQLQSLLWPFTMPITINYVFRMINNGLQPIKMTIMTIYI
jgi:hypothetical protein